MLAFTLKIHFLESFITFYYYDFIYIEDAIDYDEEFWLSFQYSTVLINFQMKYFLRNYSRLFCVNCKALIFVWNLLLMCQCHSSSINKLQIKGVINIWWYKTLNGSMHFLENFAELAQVQSRILYFLYHNGNQFVQIVEFVQISEIILKKFKSVHFSFNKQLVPE